MLAGKAPRKTLAEAIARINYDKLQRGKGSFLNSLKVWGAQIFS